MSAVLGGLLSGGVMMLTNRTPKAEAVAQPPAPVASTAPMPVPLHAPEVTIPGYRGLLYDQDRRIVGVSVEPVEAAAGRPLPTPVKSFAAPARSAPVRTAQTQKKGRSKKMSTAIIAGSAGTGAAIGAIAGGGKGAAIGAISGGAAGVVYDRTTANKQKN